MSWRIGLAVLLLAACGPQPPQHGRKLGPPKKPGESISKSIMCTCNACEPTSCCKELDQDQPEAPKDCADGYDFSKCELPVSSCEASCFEHRWRVHVDKGCDADRPDQCCQ